MDEFDPASPPPAAAGGEPGDGTRRRRRRRGPRRSQPGQEGPGTSGGAGAGSTLDAAWLEAAMAEVAGTPPAGTEGNAGRSRRRNRKRRRDGDRPGSLAPETAADPDSPAAAQVPPGAAAPAPPGGRQGGDRPASRGGERREKRDGRKEADTPAWPFGGKRLTRAVTMAPDLETAIEGPAFRRWAGPPRTIIAWVPDMFFGTKIRDTAHKMGYRVYFLREPGLVAEKVRELRPDLVVVDTATDEPTWTTILRAVRDVDAGFYPVIAFGSHRDLDSRSRALDLGASDFIANSRFFPEMHRVIEKYARIPSPEELEADGNSLDEAAANQGAFRNNPRFTRGPIVPGPADDPREEPISFVELARRSARPQIPFNPNPSDD